MERRPLLPIFARFLRFGALAWGGPVAQIGMMHRELVERERWVDEPTFRRVFGVYQALPGPEATELAVYFGYHRGGRLGGLLAGLGFVLPGFLLALALAHLYMTFGSDAPGVRGLLYAIKPVTFALILNALLRLGKFSVTNDGLGLVALGSILMGLLLDWNFVLVILLLGLAYVAARRSTPGIAAGLPVLFGLPSLPFALTFFLFFLQAGLVTFGGAYTVLPFLQAGAVEDLGWITERQFLEAIALCSLLPAPLIIVATFIGHLVWPPWGGVVATVAIFLPAFAFTLLFHERLVRLVENRAAHDLFDGITAAVVGLIVVTLVEIVPTAMPDGISITVAVAAFALLRRRMNVALVVASGALLGIALEGVGLAPV